MAAAKRPAKRQPAKTPVQSWRLEATIKAWRPDATPYITAQLSERLGHAQAAVDEMAAVLRVACGMASELTAIDGDDNADRSERRMWAERIEPVLADVQAALERLRENT